jgi:hypothetical protein
MARKPQQPKKRQSQDYVECPFTIVVDTREGAPWYFKGFTADADKKNLPLVIPTITRGLRTGDYSIDGFEDEVCVERKSVADLYMSVSAERDRFEREFNRMSSMRHCDVVVEGDLLEICTKPPPRTKVLPKTVVRTAFSWSMKYPNVHWWFCPSRDWAEKACFHLLRMYWENFCRERVESAGDSERGAAGGGTASGGGATGIAFPPAGQNGGFAQSDNAEWLF